jgi:hypothetical protein
MNWATDTGPSSLILSSIHILRFCASDCGSIFTMIYFSQVEGDFVWLELEGKRLYLATLIVCPRCRGSVQPDAHACPRCGLVLTGLTTDNNPSSDRVYMGGSSDPRQAMDATTIDYGLNGGSPQASANPYNPPVSVAPPLPSQPVRSNSIMPAASPVVVDTAPSSGSRIVPRGAIELLPEESVAFQLGALYLTNKRVILLAPSVVRAAFLRDVDAVGTLTERSSGWTLFFSLLFLGLAAVGAYASIARKDFEANFPLVYTVEPMYVAIALALAGLVLLVMYFIWVKRTLFVSVSGRPLITVSVADWSSRKLEGMDGFVNAFFQMKDAVHSTDRR